MQRAPTTALWSWDYFRGKAWHLPGFPPEIFEHPMIFNLEEYRFTSPRYPLMRCLLLDVSSDVASVEQTYLNMIFDIGRCLSSNGSFVTSVSFTPVRKILRSLSTITASGDVSSRGYVVDLLQKLSSKFT